MRDPRINPGRERFSKKVTLLSFVLALLIIVLHTTNLEVYGITAGVWYHGQCWFRALTDVVVPVFFIVSGYLYFRNFSGGEGVLAQMPNSDFQSCVAVSHLESYCLGLL